MFKHYTQSTILIQEEIENTTTTIIIDPFKISQKNLPKADILLISHSHKDHYSLEDINSVLTPNTIVISYLDIPTIDSCKEHIKLLPTQHIQINNISITATHAYNTNKEFHPKENNWLGFYIQTPLNTYYFVGDSDSIEEFSKYSQPDIAFIPISGTYVMNVEEAVLAITQQIKPKLTIPCHFAEVVGTLEDAQEFVKLLKENNYTAKIIKEE